MHFPIFPIPLLSAFLPLQLASPPLLHIFCVPSSTPSFRLIHLFLPFRHSCVLPSTFTFFPPLLYSFPSVSFLSFPTTSLYHVLLPFLFTFSLSFSLMLPLLPFSFPFPFSHYHTLPSFRSFINCFFPSSPSFLFPCFLLTALPPSLPFLPPSFLSPPPLFHSFINFFFSLFSISLTLLSLLCSVYLTFTFSPSFLPSPSLSLLLPFSLYLMPPSLPFSHLCPFFGFIIVS